MAPRQKPDKPYPDFPLTAMANGQWCKRIRNKLHYFGVWSNPDAALQKYLDQRDDLQAGRTPKKKDDTRLTVKVLCDRFYANKKNRLQSNELSQTMLNGYDRICERLVEFFGRNQIVEELTPSDFERLRVDFAKGVGLVTLSNRIQHSRTVFKFAFDQGYIDRPLKFGQDFKKPKPAKLRDERNAKYANSPKMFKPSEIKRIIATAKQPLKAMILLGINCGFGQTDCSRLPLAAIDLEKGWIDYPRPKTSVPRLCPLWPETIEALKEAIAKRRKPHSEEYSGLAFLTRTGIDFVRATDNGTNIDGVAQEFAKVLNKLKLSGSRRAFYALRHTFETIGGDTGDQVAVDMMMGHAPDAKDMSAVYRRKVFAKRLRRVIDHVHRWVWPKTAKKKAEPNVE